MLNRFVRSAVLASALILLLPVPANADQDAWNRGGGDHHSPGGGDHRDPRYNPRPSPGPRPAPPHYPPPRYNPPRRPEPPRYYPPRRPEPPRYPPPYYPPRDPRPLPPPPPPAYGRDFSQWVGQNYYGHSILPIREMLGLGAQYNGYHVESVTVRLSSQNGGDATLIINGSRASGQRIIGSYVQDYSFFPDSYNDQLGYELNSLQIELDGNFYVESVSVRLR